MKIHETTTEPAIADVADELSQMLRCRRCKYRSCERGYENHSHRCTHDPGCVDTQARLVSLQFASRVTTRARDTTSDLRTENDTLKARIRQLESIHHG